MSPSPLDLENAVRDALRSDSPSFRPVDVDAVARAAHRRRKRRVAALGAAIATIGIVAVGATVGGTGTTTVTPAQQDRDPPSTGNPRSSWAAWADCLRSKNIPGVTIRGPVRGSDEITYLGPQGAPLPRDHRETSGEWGSATEACAALVPEILPDLERQWGDLTPNVGAERAAEHAAYERCLAAEGLDVPRTAGGTADAVAAGCSRGGYDVDIDGVLECPDGQGQSGWQRHRDDGAWAETPLAAGQAWLVAQGSPQEMASVAEERGTDRLLVASRDRRTTAVLALRRSTERGWRVTATNRCLPA